MQSEITANKNAAYRLLGIQVAITAIIVLLLFLLSTTLAAYSALLGSLAFIVPNAIFVSFSLRTSATGSSSNTLVWFYVGEAVKIVSTILIFAGAFLLVSPLNIGLMFISYGFILLMNLTGLAILMNK